MATAEPIKAPARNVLGQPLDTCGCEPMTGFYRDCLCNTGPDDLGLHTICCVVTEDFLRVSADLGVELALFWYGGSRALEKIDARAGRIFGPRARLSTIDKAWVLAQSIARRAKLIG